MTCKEVMAQLKAMGTEASRRTFQNHGAPKESFGVKISDLKVLQKKLKKSHPLSLELYNTGNSDAQYLAGLIADEKKITRKDLQLWVDKAGWYMIAEYTVAWVAAESDYGYELALEWIDDPSEMKQVAGWSTLANIAAIKPDESLDLKKWTVLLKRVEQTIHKAPNRARYAMNSFIIATGTYIESLSETAIRTGETIGQVSVNMGTTACKVPSAPEYIKKSLGGALVRKKKKMARC